MWAHSKKLASCHPAGIKNFEVAPRFLEKLCTPIADWDNQLRTECVNTIHVKLNLRATPSSLENVRISVKKTNALVLYPELFTLSINSKETPLNAISFYFKFRQDRQEVPNFRGLVKDTEL